ncbi:MAG: DUF2628 domain-containing protein [Eubacterium sp.]|nr:DUF2628 domain-containing protein [Eubacterium sp.]
MIFKNGEKCIVCDKAFTEDDDIVICPYCGTPHHRGCYNQLGHCANQSRHGENYEYKYENIGSDESAEPEQENQNSAYFYSPDGKSDTVTCQNCGAENNNDTAFCIECGERIGNSFSSSKKATPFNEPYNQFAESSETIDGKRVSDISAVVGSNSKRFVDKFKSGKKTSWNWGAFFFTGYYFMFRKMYKEGAMIIALNLAVSFFAHGTYAEKTANFQNMVSSVMASASNGNIISDELISQLWNSYYAMLPMLLIIIVYSLVVSIVCGLITDNIYKKKVFSILDKVDTNLENGGSFSINPMMSEEEDFTQEQMKRFYLRKRGGITIFAPILVYLVLDILTNFVIPKL